MTAKGVAKDSECKFILSKTILIVGAFDPHHNVYVRMQMSSDSIPNAEAELIGYIDSKVQF